MTKFRTVISRAARGELAVACQELVGDNWVVLSTKEVAAIYTEHVPAGTPWGWAVAAAITIAPRKHLPVLQLGTDTDPEEILPSIY